MRTLKSFDELFELNEKLSREYLSDVIYNMSPINTEELENKSTDELEKLYKKMNCDKKLKKDKKMRKRIKKFAKMWNVG